MKRKILVLVVITVAYLLMTGFGQDITRLLGLPGKSTFEYLMVSPVILMLSLYIYEGVMLLKKTKKEITADDLAKQNRMHKDGWLVFQFMIFGLIVLYFLKDSEKFNTTGESLGFAINFITFFYVVNKLYYYFKPVKK